MASTATYLGFLLLTGNSILEIKRSRGDAAAVIFVIASHLTLLLLLCGLRTFERAAGDRARASTWLVTTLRTPIFSWRVAALLPTAVVSAVVWLMAVSTVVAGFYMLFLLSIGG
ncbi:hypothetical protein BAE44_0000056 [Dichanthelium oligosanthes]|uniref:Uncharacterized protein n=1 Tax=Dichanthelium oligosanthes TaxID=888268 RepID=A0A1E5WNE8_9POAL|nr:hypothetical protein BAE44_0000056 [Dichanthelium oligosanthes]